MAARSANRTRVSFAHGHTAVFKLVLVAAFVTALPGGAWPQSKFVSEIADGSVNEVGLFTSLALDAHGNPHVGYQDGTTLDLKYARKSGGVWAIEIAAGSASVAGWYASLALDAQGNPHVSYWGTNEDLWYARKSGGVWTIETADGSANVGQYGSLALDAQGNPHVSYYDDTNDDLKYARKSGGIWTIETADVSASLVGLYSSLALDAEGNPHVSYQGSNNDLRYARRSGGIWTTEPADGSANALGNFTSLALDAQGNPHVSYGGFATLDLKYARKSGGIWTIETVDGPANLAEGASLALDAEGNPHVSYGDFTTGDLRCARKAGGAWTIETADGSANSVGFYTSLALDAQGNTHVSYLDATTNDLKYANAAVHMVSPLGAVTWAVGSLQEVQWSGIGPVDIFLSADGGDGDEVLATDVIANTIALRVPHLPTRFARIVVDRATPRSTAASDSFFTIDATIALFRFDAASRDDDAAVALSWETAPGPEADVRYRVERSSETNAGDAPSFAPIHAGLLDRGEYLDAAPGRSARYRLIAVNGLGEEYTLGEIATASALRSGQLVTAYPNPSRGDGVEVAFRVTAGDFPTTVSVYDASGRLVRRLESGTFPAGVRSVRWDGRDERGGAVGAGVYFVRVRSGSGAEGAATLRVVP